MKKLLTIFLLLLKITFSFNLTGCGGSNREPVVPDLGLPAPGEHPTGFVPPHNHEFGSEYITDDTHHWHVCGCGEIGSKTEHSGGSATCTTKAVCSVCGKAYGATLPHSYTEEITKAATCTEKGTKTFTCTCGATYTEEIAALGHSYDSEVTKAATCTEKGVRTYTCSTCAHSYTEEIAALGHSYDSEVTKAATCTEKGLRTYTCSTCAHSYTEEIDMIEHNYEKHLTTPATCTEKGEYTYVCSVCSDTYTEEVPVNGHKEVAIPGKAATCLETGLTEGKKCSVCDTVTVEQTEIPIGDHSYSSKVTTPATCTEAGVKTYTCSVCEDSYTEVIPATGHDHKVKSDETHHWTECSCGDKTEKEAHKGGTATTTQKAKCEVCGTYYGELLPTTNITIYLNTGGSGLWNQADAWFWVHAWNEAGLSQDVKMTLVEGDLYQVEISSEIEKINFVRANPATSNAPGQWNGDADIDDKQKVWNQTDDLTIPTGKNMYVITGWGRTDGKWEVYCDHSYDNGVVTTEPTCTEKGVKTFTCTLCNHSYTEEVSAPGHSLGSWITTDSDYHWKECANCEHTAEKAAHTWIDVTVINQPTETEEGLKTQKCSVCEATREVPVPPTGHECVFDEEVVKVEYLATPATCIAKATYYYTCSCGEKGTETFEYGDYADHTFTKYVESKPATYESNAEETATCDVEGCNETDTREIPDSMLKPVVLDGYYLVGSFSDWKESDDYKFQVNPGNNAEVMLTNVHLNANDEFQIRLYVNGEVSYFGYAAAENKDYITESNEYGNIVAKANGTYNFYFKKEAKQVWIGFEAPVTIEGTFYLFGSMNGWSENENYILVLNPEKTTELYIQNVELAAGTELKVVQVVPGRDNNWNGYNKVKGDKNLISGEGDGNIIIKAAGIYDFYYDINEGIYIGLHEHNYEEEISTEATCENEGLIIFTCECGHSYTETIPATGHSYEGQTAAYEWSEDNSKVVASIKCANCEHVLTEEAVTSSEVTKEPVGATNGERTYTATFENKLFATQTKVVVELANHTHDYNVEVTEPTCTEEGYTTYTCKDEACGHTYVDDKKPATGHSYEGQTAAYEWSEDNSKVVASIKCANCEHVLTEEAETTVEVTKDATADEDGIKVYTATFENTLFAEQTKEETYEFVLTEITFIFTMPDWADETPAPSLHYWGEQGSDWNEIKENPNMAKVSGRTYKLTIDLSKGKLEGILVYFYQTENNTVNTKQSQDYKGDEINQAGVYVIELKGGNWTDNKWPIGVTKHEHSYTEITTAATCTEDGVKTFTCTCGDSYTETIPATGHSHKPKVTAPTCTEAGYTTYTCTCGDTYKDNEVKELGHAYESVVTDPTCTEKGYTTHTCANDSTHTYVDSYVNAKGHDWVHTSYDLVNEQWMENQDCSRCDETQQIKTNAVVATVNGLPYTSLADAINAANGTEIKLVSNIELEKSLEIKTEANINLNGYTISNPNDMDSDGVFHVINGKLTINGGTVNGTTKGNYHMAIWVDGGEVVINGGTYTNLGATDDGKNDQHDLIYVKNGGKLTINGGTFICETPRWTVNERNELRGTVEICGGSFYEFDPSNLNTDDLDSYLETTKYHAIKDEKGYYNVSIHTVVTDKAKAATCTATGLTEGSHCSVCKVVLTEQTSIPAKGHEFNLEVYQNDANKHWNKCIRCEEITAKEEHTYNENLICTVCNYNKGIQANVDGKNYATLAEAILAAEGREIFLEANLEFETGFLIDSKVIINLNGHKVSTPNDTLGDGVFHVVKNGHLTLTGNGTVDGVGKSAYTMAIYANGGTVVIENGTYTNVGSQPNDPKSNQFDLIYANEGGTIIINGGTFKAEHPRWTVNKRNPEKEAAGVVNTIIINGGSFYEFDPSNLTTDDDNSYINRETHHTVRNNGGYYTLEEHNHTEIEAVAPTCTKTGLTAGDYCSICNKVLIAQEEVKELGHAYESVVTLPTCTAEGYTTHTCSRCKDTYTDSTTSMIPHDYQDQEVKYVLTENKTWVKETLCKECGYKKIEDATEVVSAIKDTPYMSLEEAYANANEVDTITLYQNVNLSKDLEMNTAITLDFNGHTVEFTSTKGFRPYVNVTFINGTILNKTYNGRCIDIRMNANIVVDNMTLTTTSSGNNQPITVGGSTNGTTLTVRNTTIEAGIAGYAIIVFVQSNINIEESYINGYSALYLKEDITSNELTKVNVAKSTISSVNNSTVDTNSFATIVIDGSNVDVLIDKESIVKAITTGNQLQYVVGTGEIHTPRNYTVTINGTVELVGEYAKEIDEIPCTNKVIINDKEYNGTRDHEVVVDKAVAATCTKTGLTEGSHCELCNTVIVTQEVVKELGHAYESVVTTDPTCTEKGLKTYTCSNCSDSYTEELSANGHEYSDEYITDEYTHSLECGNCEHVETMNHSLKQSEFVLNNSEITGVKYICECGHEENLSYVTIYFQNNWKWTNVHAYVFGAEGDNSWPGASLTSLGTSDGHELYAFVVDVTKYDGIIFNGTKDDGSGNIDQTPDITLNNIAINNIICMEWNDGNAIKEFPISSVNDASHTHSFVKTSFLAATCTSEGTDKYTCNCNEDFIVSTSKLGHSFTKYEITTQATCETNRFETAICDRCDKTDLREVEESSLGHDYKSTVTEPTCTKKGFTTHNCQRVDCGHSYVDNYTNIIDHTSSEQLFHEEGDKHWDICTVCGAKFNISSHSFDEGMENGNKILFTCDCGYSFEADKECEHDWIVASCTTPKTCSICHVQEGEPLGHEEVSHEAKAATCTEIGWDAYVTCNRCDYSTYNEKAKLGHDEVSHEAKDATCTAIGWEAYVKCSRCDYTTYKEISVLGHDWNNGTTSDDLARAKEVTIQTCSRCKGTNKTEKDIKVIYLKPNSNWKINNARFAAYFFGNGEKWVKMESIGNDIYAVKVPDGYQKVIFCRMNPSTTANNWNNKWNQTGDLDIPTDGNYLFTVPNGAWDVSTSSWSKKS